MKRAAHGFTLIEVLVALAIVAISLSAGLQASGALTRLAERQSQQWLAQLCAQNALVQVRLQNQLPSVGESTLNCNQAGTALRVDLRATPTPNPSFRRVDAQVTDPVGGHGLLRLSTVVGRY